MATATAASERREHQETGDGLLEAVLGAWAKVIVLMWKP